MNRITTSMKTRSKSSFLCSPSHGTGRSSVEKADSSVEGFPRNAIKWRNEIPMTPTAVAAFQRAHENDAVRGSAAVVPREIWRWLKLNEHSRRAREEDRMSSVRLIKLPIPFGLSGNETRRGFVNASAESREISESTQTGLVSEIWVEIYSDRWHTRKPKSTRRAGRAGVATDASVR